jgi:Cu/Ag efflux pump CusA
MDARHRGAASRRLLAIPEVLSVEEQVGRAEAGEDTWPPASGANSTCASSPWAGAGGRGPGRNPRAGATPALQGEVTTFLGDRIRKASGETAAIAISIQGADLDTLDRTGATIAAALRATPGATDVAMKAAPGTPMLGVTLDPARMALHG